MKPLQILLAITASIGVLGLRPLMAQIQSCPYPVSVSLTCETDRCKKTVIVRNCGPTMGNPSCCNPDATWVNCCGDPVYIAGNSGDCPPTGSKDCHFGLIVVAEDSRVMRACAGGSLPYLNMQSVKPPSKKDAATI
jgi:hypothetical protein